MPLELLKPKVLLVLFALGGAHFSGVSLLAHWCAAKVKMGWHRVRQDAQATGWNQWVNTNTGSVHHLVAATRVGSGSFQSGITRMAGTSHIAECTPEKRNFELSKRNEVAESARPWDIAYLYQEPVEMKLVGIVEREHELRPFCRFFRIPWSYTVPCVLKRG